MSDEREERLKKVDALRGLGVDPYGKRFDGARPIGPLVETYAENEGKECTVAGRVMAHRQMGKAVVFADLRDQTGKVQCYFKKNDLGDAAWQVFADIGIGDILGVTGTLGRTKTGEMTVFAKSFALLTKALRPLPEKWHGLKDPEVRYRHRYLDLIANPDVRENFLRRTRIVNRIRDFLNARGYVEVETPVLVKHAGGANARPFRTHHNTLGMDLSLRISLEIPLKKLMVGGIERVYEIGRVFRNEGIDASHNPEFTLLELYHAYGDLRTIMELMESLVAHLARELHGSAKVPWHDGTLSVEAPWPRLDYFELISKHVEPQNPDALRAKLREKGVDPSKLAHAELLDAVFGEFVEPGLQDAVFVTGQPIEQTPLCREIPDRPGRADRFESFLAGMEISNAYTELNDAIEQRRRVEAQKEVDEDFLLALEHGMPPAGGLGVGIDRLVRILTNQRNLREVILFPLLGEANPAAVPPAS